MFGFWSGGRSRSRQLWPHFLHRMLLQTRNLWFGTPGYAPTSVPTTTPSRTIRIGTDAWRHVAPSFAAATSGGWADWQTIPGRKSNISNVWWTQRIINLQNTGINLNIIKSNIVCWWNFFINVSWPNNNPENRDKRFTTPYFWGIDNYRASPLWKM